MLMIVLGLVLFIIAAAVYLGHDALEKRKNDRRAATRKKELDKFYTSPLKALENVDIVPDDGEVFYYAGVADWELCANGAQPQIMARQPGMVYLSNQRLCFLGALGGEEKMAFGAWRTFEIRPSEIELQLPNGSVAFIYSDDIFLGPTFTRLTKKQFAPLHS